MSSGQHTVYIPGDVSVDIVESVKMAIDKLHPYRRTLWTGRRYIGTARDKFGGVAPAARRLLIPGVPARFTSAVSRAVVKATSLETNEDKARRVKRELIDAGITFYGLMKAESRTLHRVLHPNEHVEAIVYGQHRANSVMLVATDERIIYLDKKPMALFLDEVSYEVVSGIEFEIHTLFATLVLHTPVKNYDIRYANLRCAEKFARHIEAHRLKREKPGKEPELEEGFADQRTAQEISEYPYGLKEDMAGYYWLSTEEEERRNHQATRKPP